MRRAAWPRGAACFYVWLGLTVLLAACERAPDPDAAELRPVTLPDLEAFPEAVRQQVRDRHARLDTLAGTADAARLAEAYGSLGLTFMAYDLNDPAEPALLNAAALRPDDHRWPYYLGHLYHEEGRLQEAARQVERALELDPDYVPTCVALAAIYRDLGRTAEARSMLRDVLDEHPESGIAHLLLGHIAAGENEHALAVEHYERVLELQPDASVVHYPLAMAYRELGDRERSREHLEKRGRTPVRYREPLLDRLVEIREGVGARMHRATELAHQGRFREAAALYEEAVRADSNNAWAYLGLAIAAARARDTDRAIRAAEQAVRLDPDNIRARFTLGYFALLSDQPGARDEAAEQFRAALAADSGSVVTHAMLGRILWRDGRCAEAIPHLEKYLEERPAEIRVRLGLAVCHSRLGAHAQALALLEEGHRAAPDDPQLQIPMVRLLAASPDPDVRDGSRALEIAERLAVDDRSPRVRIALAMALAERGRFADAIRVQQQVIRQVERSPRVPAAMVESLRNDLRLYQEHRPSRTPWPETVFQE